jgi:hypothetical protein
MFDFILWSQGEANLADDSLSYKADFIEVLDTLYNQNWYSSEKPFLALGMGTWDGATASGQNELYRDFAVDENPFTSYINSDGLSHAAFDNFHFEGTAVDTIGKRAYRALKSLPYSLDQNAVYTVAGGDGSKTIVTPGTNVTVTGVGTVGDPYVVGATGGSGDMVLNDVQTVTGIKTFGEPGNIGKFRIAGLISGSVGIIAPAVAGFGSVTLPTTGTLSTLAGTETLTNKTITGSTMAYGSNTMTNVASLNTPQVFTAGARKSFQANATTAGIRLLGVTSDPSAAETGGIWYRGDTEKYTYRGTASNRSLVTEFLAQPLTNKTIAIGSNTFTGAFSDANIASASTWNSKISSISEGYGMNIDNTTPTAPIAIVDTNVIATQYDLTQIGGGSGTTIRGTAVIQHDIGDAVTVVVNPGIDLDGSQFITTGFQITAGAPTATELLVVFEINETLDTITFQLGGALDPPESVIIHYTIHTP